MGDNTNDVNSKKLEKKERKEKWKAAKRERRQEQKEFYKYAPGIVRGWNLYLKKPACVVLVLCLIVGLCLGPLKGPITDKFQSVVSDYYFSTKNAEISESEKGKIYDLSPIDEEGNKKIDAFPAVGADIAAMGVTEWKIDDRFRASN